MAVSEKSGTHRRHNPGLYFSDGLKRIDYVLVYNIHNKKSDDREKFLENLQLNELEIEEDKSMIDNDLRFIKVHAPKHVLIRFAEHFDIPIKYQQKSYLKSTPPRFKFRRTELTSPDPLSPNYNRATETFSGEKPKKFLSSERNLIVFNILKRIPYGHQYFTGVLHLLRKEVFIAAYPLHDGTHRWNDNPNKPLNDRQILKKYWTNWTMFYKRQPLDTIERYFGVNIALYFAWLQFYTKMLLWPVFLGIILFIYDWCSTVTYNVPIEEVCNSDKLLCPICTSCPVKFLNTSCTHYKITYFFDNFATVVYAIAMSFWAAIYTILWRRKEAVLVIKWNMQGSEYEEQDLRPEYEHFANDVRITEFGEPEQYITFYRKIWRIIVSALGVLFMIVLVLASITGIIYFEIDYARKIKESLVATFMSSLITVVAILVLRRIYNSIVVKLTNLEVPRTQTDFDNSYIFKVFVFSFINNYGALIYVAFLKGKFYTYPDDPKIYNAKTNFMTDICDPSGCLSEVYILLQLIMIVLPILTHLINYISSGIQVSINRTREKKAQVPHETLPQWERDYELMDLDHWHMLLQYEEMVIQFGFVTFFSFAFPFAPLLALIHNLIKTRLDAQMLLLHCRRPQSKRIASIGAWLDIMKWFIYFSVFSNAMYITFTSNCIMKIYYKYKINPNLKGFIDFTLAEYHIDTKIWRGANVENGTLCWYPALRNPPDHKFPYDLNYEYYIILTMKFTFIIVFEHMVLIITGLTRYIPDIPQSVKDKIAFDMMEVRKIIRDASDNIHSTPSVSSSDAGKK